MKLPKIPIDYSRAGTGEAPFDGKFYMLHHHHRNTKTIAQFLEEKNDGSNLSFYDAHGAWVCLYVTHWSPMPEFEEVNNDHK